MTVHVPILLQTITKLLLEPHIKQRDAVGAWHVDCTFGGGGHTRGMLEAFAAEGLHQSKVLAFDQDLSAIERGRLAFAQEIASGRLELVHARFSEAAPWLKGRAVLSLLADLGFSSDQLDDGMRGLSFMREGPLDMRMDRGRGLSCREYLAKVREEELAKVIWECGEERFSRRIARAIVNSREAGTLPATTQALAELVLRAVPPPARHGRIHAATRTFQALRIQVNEELEELDNLLGRVILDVKQGGRVAVISFHSLEDRKVKQCFPKRPNGGPFLSLSKKPIEADEVEVQQNPRARSAKLRVAERVQEEPA